MKLIGIMVLIGALLVSGGLAAQQDNGTIECNIGFEATVRQGPSTGLLLEGNLHFTVTQVGELTGEFVLKDGPSVPTMGQVTGRAISLVFDLGRHIYIFGTGTALHPLMSQDCGGPVGGTFAGPSEGDLGDWVETDTVYKDNKAFEIKDFSFGVENP